MSIKEEQSSNVIDVLLEQNKALGRIEQKIDDLDSNFRNHVADDKVIALKVESLEADHHHQLGRASVWALVGTTIGSAISGAIGYFVGRNP